MFKFNADDFNTDAWYQKFKVDRNYDYEDTVTVSRKTIPDYDIKVANFLREHIHDDEETRAVLDGKA